MLSITDLKLGDEDYYLDLAEDYYFGGTEPAGQWIGGGCQYLGLCGRVTRDTFKRVFRGFHPFDGGGPDAPDQWIPLVQSAGKPNHQPGWDLTFSPPKSVSTIWSQASEEMRKEIEQLHLEAIKYTVDFIEKNYAFSRTGKAGQGGLVPVKLVVSAFEHGTSRAVEPQLHSHAITHNVGVDDSDPLHPKFRTVVSKKFYDHKMLSGAIYRARFAHTLHAKYGFVAERKRNEFDIKGVSQELIDTHSTRRKEIVADLHKKGVSGAKAAEKSNLATRRKKGHQFPREMLFPEWQKTNAMHGFDDEALEALIRPPQPNYDYQQFVPTILKQATKGISRNRNHFTIFEFLREALFAAPQYGVSPDILLDAVHKHLNESPDIVPIPTHNRYTTKAILEQEIALLKTVEKLQARKGARVSDKVLAKVLANHPKLNAEQRSAVKHLTQSDAAIRVVQGYAGVGKTTMLRPAVEAWKQQGFNVVGACFTGAAAQKLQAEIGIPCDTIDMTLVDLKPNWSDSAKRYLKYTGQQLVRAALKKRTFMYGKPKRPKINRKSIVLLDEASMINTRHMRMLTDWVEKNGATIALVGDPAQLAAIEGGSPLQSLSNRVGFAEVTEIQRQRDEWARTAAHCMATGKIAQAMALYAERNLVTVRPDMDQAMKELIDQWTHYAWDRPERAAILALTNKQVEQANELAQQKRIEKGALDPKKFRRIVSQKKGSNKIYRSNVHVHDRVVFTESNRTYRIRNGNAGTVIGFTHYKSPLRPAIRVRLDLGPIVTVPLNFRHIRLGYASTVHRAEGETIPTVFVLAGGPSQNLPTTYVQGTRSQEATRFFTEQSLYDEIQQDIQESELVAQMQRQVDLSLASDLFRPVLGTAPTRQELVEQALDHATQHLAAGGGPAAIITSTAAEAEVINKRCSEINYAMAQIERDNRQKLASTNRSREHDNSPQPNRPRQPKPQSVTPSNHLILRKQNASKPSRPAYSLAEVRRKIAECATKVRQFIRPSTQPQQQSPPQTHQATRQPRPIYPSPEQVLKGEGLYPIYDDSTGQYRYVPYAQFEDSHRARVRAMSLQQAASSNMKVENAYVLPADPSRVAATPYSAAQYQPTPVVSPTVFQSSSPAGSRGIQAQNTFLFTQQEQSAADWQQKMALVNQTTPAYVQQQEYLSQLASQKTQIEIEHKYSQGI